MSGTAIPAIPAPVTADPGFWQKGIEGLNALRDQQAKQASADAYRQSLNPDGTVNTPKYNALIAGGPGAWNAGPLMEQQGRAAGAQAQAGSAQADQAQKVYNFVAAPSASLMNDPTDANLANIRSQLVTAGAPPGVIAELDRMKTLSEADRRTVAYQHNMAGADTQHRLAAGGFPTPVITQFGGTSAPTMTTPATPYGPGKVSIGNGIAHTVDPATYYGPQDSPILYDANGQVTTDPTKAVRKVDRVVPRGSAFGMPPPGSVGGPPPAGPGAAGLPPGAPPPPAGTGLVLKNGQFQRPAAPSPSGAPPAPSQPPSVVAPPPVTSPTLRGPGSPATPPVAGVVTGLPTGREAATITEQEADQKQFIADRTAIGPRQTQEQNLRHAYDALKLVTTGKGTENASALRNLLVTAGVAGASTANDEAVYEYGRKYLERTIAEAGNEGGTDTARALAAQSNPNVSLVNPANLAFLRNDIGKKRQQMAAYMTAPDTTIGKGFGKHSADIASNTDYRGFNWDDYSDSEQKEIMKSVGASGTKAHDALARAIGMGRTFWPQRGAGPIVPHAAVSPSGPASNMLAMAQPQGNPLLAA